MDVNEQNWQTAVIERSRTLPVVVDFWAEWCGPCRQLGPQLERAVAARSGQVELVKVDVDANPGLSRAFRIQGIPAVKAFRNGEMVAEFTGNQPPAAIERFLDGLVPSPAEALVAAGDEASLRRALELEPARRDAIVPLARILLARGERDEALELLGRAPGDFQAEGLLARIELEGALQNSAIDLPDLPTALQALDQGETAKAIDLLINSLPHADGHRDDLRRMVVGILAELDVNSDLARDSRRRLAAALY